MTLTHVTGKKILEHLELSIEELKLEITKQKEIIVNNCISGSKLYEPSAQVSKINHIEAVIDFKTKHKLD